MTNTCEEALEAAVTFLAAKLKNRLEIVEHIPAPFYSSFDIEPDNYWIIHVQPEQLMIDGIEQYILIDKTTGATQEIASPG